jgi:hypothetical protein
METRLLERVDTSWFSQLVYELNKLNWDGDFYWPPKSQAAFERVKKRLKSSPLISYPDPTKDFVLVTDASLVAVRAVLMQRTTIRLLPKWQAIRGKVWSRSLGVYRPLQQSLSNNRFIVEYIPGEQIVWDDKYSRPFGIKKPVHADIHTSAEKICRLRE